MLALWNLLTNADPFFSLFPVAPPPAAVFPLLPSAPGLTPGARAPAGTGCPVPAARHITTSSFSFATPTVRVTSSSRRWVSARCPILPCKARLRCGGDIHTQVCVRVRRKMALQKKISVPCRRSPPGGVLRSTGPGAPPAPSQPPGSARRSVTGTTQKNTIKGCGVGEALTGSPSAKLATSRAAAARVAPRAVRGCAAGQSLRGLGGPPRRARPWEREGARRRLGGNHRGKPTEDAYRTKKCP